MNIKSKIYVAGHTGMVGSSVVNMLYKKGFKNIITRTSKDLDLRCYESVFEFFSKELPEYVILTAAKVGGISANMNNLSGFLTDNAYIELNVINAAHEFKVKKLMFLGSSCIYPKEALQPLKEEYLMTGPLEPTNEGYALAKILGIKLCQYYKKEYGDNFISIMPSNIYGPGDNFDINTSHVMAALIGKMHYAKINEISKVVVWGSGHQFREFMYVEDLADAILYLLDRYNGEDFINVGTGSDITIKDLALKVKRIVGYDGELAYDLSKPDGMYRKVLDVTKLNNLGWKYKTDLNDGIKKTYEWYLDFKHKSEKL